MPTTMDEAKVLSTRLVRWRFDAAVIFLLWTVAQLKQNIMAFALREAQPCLVPG
jgi:hypothetical protein